METTIIAALSLEEQATLVLLFVGKSFRTISYETALKHVISEILRLMKHYECTSEEAVDYFREFCESRQREETTIRF